MSVFKNNRYVRLKSLVVGYSFYKVDFKAGLSKLRSLLLR